MELVFRYVSYELIITLRESTRSLSFASTTKIVLGDSSLIVMNGILVALDKFSVDVVALNYI